MAEGARDTEQLVVSLEARIRDFERNFQRANKVANDNWRSIEGRGNQASRNLERTFAQSSSRIGTALSSIGGRGALSGLTAAISVETVRRYADEWTSASNKIGAAIGDVSKAAGNTDLVADIASRSRSAFSETADLYSRLTRAGKDLKASQGDIAVVTETVSKALSLSGATAQEAAAGALQLGQALSSGRLQGDELRSLSENAPLIMEAIAKEFGVATSALKELGSNGELTADRVFKALKSAAPEVEKAFNQTTATTAQGLRQLETAAIRYVGQSNTVKGATSAMGAALSGVASNFDTVASGATALGAIIASRLVANGLTPATAGLVGVASTANALSPALGAVAARATVAATAMNLFSGALRLIGGPVGAAILGVVAAVTYAATEAGKGSDVNRAYAAAFDQVKASAGGATPAIKGAGDAAADTGRKMADAAKAKEQGNLKVFAEDATNLTTTLRSLIGDLERFGATGVNAENKARALDLLKAALDGDQKAAIDARAALVEMGSANPNFANAFSAFDALLGRLATVRQAAVNARSAIAGVDADQRIANSLRGVDTTGEDARNAGLRQRGATAAFEREQEKLSRLTTEQKAIADRSKRLQDEAKKAGGFLPDANANVLARRLTANEEAANPKGGGGKSDTEKQTDAINRQVESLAAERREIEAEVAALGKSNAEKRIATELATKNVDATSAQGQAIRDHVTAIEAGEAAVKRFNDAQKAAKQTAEFFGNTLADGLSDLIIEGKSLADVFEGIAKSIAKAAFQSALMGSGPLGNLGVPGQNGAAGGLIGALLGGIRLADGGYVSGPGTGRSDSIPARLSHGEFVVNARATSQHLDLLAAINAGRLPGFSDGGLVTAPALSTPTMPSAGSMTGNQQVFTIAPSITLNAQGGTPDQNEDLSKKMGRQVENVMRRIVADELRSQMRPGGTLSR